MNVSAARAEPWRAWRPAVCVPDCFCEQPRPGLIRQPADTWSNLAYVAVGVALLAEAARAPRRRSGRLGDDARHTALYGALIVFLGAGSFFFHASLTLVGEWFDVFGMYVVMGYLALYALRRSKLLPGSLAGWFAALAASSAAVLSFHAGMLLRLPLFAAILAVLLAVELFNWTRGQRRMDISWLAAALLCFFVSFAIWTLDKTRVLCDPESLLQGHAVWHVLGAACLAALFFYFRSEAAAS